MSFFCYLFAVSSRTRNLAVADLGEDSGEDGSDTENTTSTWSPSWERNDINPPPLPDKLYPKPTPVSTPYEYFLKLFPLEVIDHIVYQTNLYVKQKDINTSFATNRDEIMNFIGLLLYMGVCDLPSLDDYWAKETRVPQVANVMSSKQFRYLRRHIHFNDNEFADESGDNFYKIRPLFNFITQTFQQVPPTTKQSIDEVMVGYKGTRAGNLRQYIKSKPTKWGFKLFCRASDDGFVHDIILYQGGATFTAHPVSLTQDESCEKLSTKVVLVLAKTITSTTTSSIYADNFFTSLHLANMLRDHYNCRYTGTARENRVGRPPLMSPKIMGNKKTKRGSFDYCSRDGTLVVRWKDNKVVTLLTNDKGVFPLKKILRYSKEKKKKEEVDCPLVVSEYNAHMGGIDKSDMLVQLYRTPMKSKRYYLRLFAYVLDLCLVNSWLLYRRECETLKTKFMCLKKFRLEVSSFTRCAKPTLGRVLRNSDCSSTSDFEMPVAVRGQRATLPEDSIKLDSSKFHFPIYVDRQTCKHCSRKGNIIRSHIACSVCKVNLCLKQTNNCFVDFHKAT